MTRAGMKEMGRQVDEEVNQDKNEADRMNLEVNFKNEVMSDL